MSDLTDLKELTAKLGTDTSNDATIVAEVLVDLHKRLADLEYKFAHPKKDDK